MKWLPLCSLETGVQTCSVATVRMVSQRWRLCAVTIAAGGTVSLLAHGILSIQRGIPHQKGHAPKIKQQTQNKNKTENIPNQAKTPSCTYS